MGNLLAALGEPPETGLADRLLEEFGSLGAILAAGTDAQRRITNEPRILTFLEHLRAALIEVLRPDALDGPVFSDAASLCDYLRIRLARIPSEELWALFLDASNRLIREEQMARGSRTETPAYPQSILKRALELNATALIVVHNHPSGDATPTLADIRATRALACTAEALGIALHDHLIVTSSQCASLRQAGHLA